MLLQFFYFIFFFVNIFCHKTLATSPQESSIFNYSGNNPNIIILLLDEYQKELFEEILDEKLKGQLQGFIWFSDTISTYSLTPTSMLTIFTSDAGYHPNLDIRYKLSAHKSIATRFQEAEGKVNSSGATKYTKIHKLYLAETFSITENTDEKFLYKTLLAQSFFKAVPDIIKSKVYSSANQLLHFSFYKSDSYNINGVYREFPWIKPFIETKPVVKSDHPATFKVFYFFLTHFPTRYDKNCNYIGKIPNVFKSRVNQGRCAIRIVLDFINNLKDADIFDNTMILIMSDHGTFFATPEIFKKHKPRFPYNLASSTLLIKPLGRTKPFTIDDYPAQLLDIPKTIAQAMNLPHEDYEGFNLLSDKKVSSRMRFHFSQNTIYEIRGPSRDPKNWRKKCSVKDKNNLIWPVRLRPLNMICSDE